MVPTENEFRVIGFVLTLQNVRPLLFYRMCSNALVNNMLHGKLPVWRYSVLFVFWMSTKGYDEKIHRSFHKCSELIGEACHYRRLDVKNDEGILWVWEGFQQFRINIAVASNDHYVSSSFSLNSHFLEHLYENIAIFYNILFLHAAPYEHFNALLKFNSENGQWKQQKEWKRLQRPWSKL